MSSYRGGGPWDGGPPGAEADYAPQQASGAATPAAYAPRAMPSTDPWTGVSYTHYATPQQYDYQAYGAGYGYGYDPSYYQRPDGTYYSKYPDSRGAYPPAPASGGLGYSPPEPRRRSRSPAEGRTYERRRSYSRSVSPYEKSDRGYSRTRDNSYEGGSRSRSRSKAKRTKYSSSDRSSSRSRSYSRSSTRKDKKKRRTASSDSSASDNSYKKKASRAYGHSLTPNVKTKSTSRSHNRSRSRSHRSESEKRSRSRSLTDDTKVAMSKAHSSKEMMSKAKRNREVATPSPRIKSEPRDTPPKGHKRSDKSASGAVTPPKSYKKSDHIATPPKGYKRKTSPEKRKHRESSLTPPKSYARSRSSSSSKSRSRSTTPRHSKRKRSRSPKSKRSSSRSSSRSSDSSRSRSKHQTRRKSASKHRSRSKSRSRRRSLSKSRSNSRRRSRSKGNRSVSPKGSKSRSKSRGSRSHSRSPSGTPSEDERRGQFTVADRKRFWKLHKSRQEEKGKGRVKSPPKEVKPPPGAEENTKVDDIEYGDPPEVEGPNFAELLPTAAQVLKQGPSTSKSKNIPIPIKNDGSFLEMFKKMQEETKKVEEIQKKPEIKKPLPFIGKRRGGRVLKTGLVKKAKAIDEQTVDNTPKDAWSLYMQEVKKYRETSCEEERKTRPLVK